MARRTARTQDSPLFAAQQSAYDRRIRRQRALFIPRLVAEATRRLVFDASADAAHALVVKWAELESSGKLAKARETTIDTQFLDQVFGEGLGYALKTESPDHWQLEHKYPVPETGIADGALGDFPAARRPSVVIELKDAQTDLDRDRSNGRTPVDQCWDYLNAMPECPWGIVSNFSIIRLYHRSKGKLAYEEFTLQELRDRARFNEFYCIFERGGLLPSRLSQKPRALAILEQTETRQKEVGDDLYKFYHLQRLRLIDHLMRRHDKAFDPAIAAAQKVLDRIIFIAFCEDRGLLPEKQLAKAHDQLNPFSRAVNPRWKNFVDLFRAVDKGAPRAFPPIDAFNGGLFAEDPDVDALELEDEPWTQHFKSFGEWDFSEEINVDVLGHLFERSITELEKLRIGGRGALLAGLDDPPASASNGRGKKAAGSTRASTADAPGAKMPKSAQRKRFGIYYTPPAFTGLIVERTVDAVIRERFAALAAAHAVDPESRDKQDPRKLHAYWNACLQSLKAVTVCDPACGSGAFLIRAYDALDAHYKAVVHGLAGSGLTPPDALALQNDIPDFILNHNLYGVDLSKEGVEITQLALWIRSARKGRTLSDLSKHIIHGNSLVADPAVDPKALDWHKAFPGVFGKGGPGGFTCVIGNPPWERVKVQDREFFSLTDPVTAESVSAADRKKRIAAMPTAAPDLHASYLAARDRAQKMLDYARSSDRYPFTGKGDVNLYMLFAELARSLVAPDGMVGVLVPSGIATDDTTKEFFADLMDSKRLVSLYDFENRNKVFEDVDGRFKFSALVFGGSKRRTEKADFVFFAHDVEDTEPHNKKRHIPLTAADMALLNPNTRTCPIFRTRRDADLTKGIYKRVPILIDHNRKSGGNPWGVKFFTMFHQTNDAEHFKEAKVWEKKGYKLRGNVYAKSKARALPLYEAKMVQAYDHRAASVMVEEGNWVRQGQKAETYEVQWQNPEYAVLPRWWVDEGVVEGALEGQPNAQQPWLLLYKDVTSATNERTMIAALAPRVAVVNSAPVVFFGEEVKPRRECCLLANLNSFVYDFVARQKVGSVHLNFFIVEQLPVLSPDRYAEKCPWSKRETLEHWISERVLKLSCTAEDMIPLASACGFKGSRGDGVHLWRPQERDQIRAELDAAYFHLYGVEREDAEYMLSTFSHTGFIAPDARGEGGPAWERGSIGEAVLDAFDQLAALSL